MDRLSIINALAAGGAIVAGLYARSLLAALAVWLWVSLLQAGLSLLSMAQSDAWTVPGLGPAAPWHARLTQAIDAGLQMTQVSFAKPDLLAYFLASAGTLLVLTLACFLIRSVAIGLARLVLPRKASA